MTNPIFLNAQDVGWRVEEKSIVQDISLALRPDEFFVIMGPNGSGKTSLLKILAGLVLPTQGQVEVAVGPGSFMPMHTALEQQKVTTAFVFDAGGLISNATIFDNIALPLRYRGIMPEAQIREAVYNTLRQFNLDEHAGMRPSFLSPGERKRAQIARAKVVNPTVVFYDNPQFGLDAVQNGLLRDAILNLHRDGGRLTVVSTGLAGWEVKAADRVAVLNWGKLEALGSWDELLAHPSAQVQAFLRSG